MAAALEFDRAKQGLSFVSLSRLFIYYNEREGEGTVASDAGARLRDGIKTINHAGACQESLWRYDPNKVFEKPPASAYAEAVAHRGVRYHRLAQDVKAFQACLAAGYPFVFGFSVYADFLGPEAAQTGVVEMPDPDEPMVGGHAVLAVGYDVSTSRLVAQNSQGVAWGMHGYFTIPFAYVGDPSLARDFWTVRYVTD